MSEMFRDKVDIDLTVNGEAVQARVPAGQHVIDFLRQELSLTGAHASCEHGVCGACTIRVDGEAVRGCLMLAAQLDGTEIWTVEGLSDNDTIRDLQDAFIARNSLQCGFCTPGMLVTCIDMMRRGRGGDEATVRDELSGNMCRCTGYVGIVKSVLAANEVLGR